VALEVWPSLALEKIEDLRGPALASRSMTVLTSSRIKEASTFRSPPVIDSCEQVDASGG
jgi:hypothetical protein